MTQRRSPKQDRQALRHFLTNAGEVGIKSYVEMILGALRARAASTSSNIDDVIVVLLEVLVFRLFQPPARAPESEVQDDVPK